MTDAPEAKITHSRPHQVGRPSAARSRILTTADRLFYEEGIRSVGVHRVVDESAVTRVTLYRHFPSKDDLVVAYLQNRAAANEAAITAMLAEHAGDPRAGLRGMAEMVAAGGFADEHNGCAFINASAEHLDRSHPARAVATRHRKWIIDRTADLLRELGHPTPEAMAQILMMLRTGAVVGASLDDSPGIETNFLRAWDALVATI
ncbi:DNA-binding transcriptional regulator, AcrR family [Nakamurella panacisegetis]|uniref:DNA-binding transcriptional regulator, AcrR family n=1 Tax=Nakamurella panacisegetis TaxID=1090615 RepID=A0A1H0HSZ8_9ACTN|nr:TetR/AcrR family transcriptional regulator [Nakamurella panacisegetis]SDO22214.1 DNA-binding transcriptional regulator, AcrR family [Nakamurella panacisegetis]